MAHTHLLSLGWPNTTFPSKQYSGLLPVHGGKPAGPIRGYLHYCGSTSLLPSRFFLNPTFPLSRVH